MLLTVPVQPEDNNLRAYKTGATLSGDLGMH
jgi:hypothetical protein